MLVWVLRIIILSSYGAYANVIIKYVFLLFCGCRSLGVS